MSNANEARPEESIWGPETRQRFRMKRMRSGGGRRKRGERRTEGRVGVGTTVSEAGWDRPGPGSL